MNDHNPRSALEMSGFKMRTEGVAKRIQNITVSAIKEMMHLAQDYPEAVSLAQGTPNFLTPEHIRESLKQELDNNPKIGKYAPFAGIMSLKQATSQKLKANRGIEADPKTEIYITSGAMEAIATAILTVVDPGDEVILLSPCFPSYIVQVTLAEGISVFCELKEDDGWSLDIDLFKSKITSKTKAVVVCNPSNPTGTVLPEETQRKIAALAKEHGFWVITDEPYDFLVYDDNQFFSISQIPEMKDQLIGCFSFSKEYAMSGFRVGYVYTAADMVNQMLKIHDAFVVSTATPSQYAALAALQGPQDNVTYFIEKFTKKRELMCGRLDQLSDLFSYQKPRGAYYIFTKIEIDIDDYDLAIRLLKEAGVIVVPGSAFGPNGKGHIRFCFAQSEEDIVEAFDRIDGWWNENKSKITN